MPIYDFLCELGCGTHEKRVGYEVAESGCPKCGGPAQRKSVYQVVVHGETVSKLTSYATKGARIDPRHLKEVGTPAAKRRFKEQRGELKYRIAKKEQEVGQGLPGPNHVASEAARASGLDPHAQSGLMRKEIRHRSS